MRPFKMILHQANTYLEMINSNQKYAKKFQKCQNYSKYHSQIFAGKYDKFAGNFRHCRPMSNRIDLIIFQGLFEKMIRLLHSQ